MPLWMSIFIPVFSASLALISLVFNRRDSREHRKRESDETKRELWRDWRDESETQRARVVALEAKLADTIKVQQQDREQYEAKLKQVEKACHEEHERDQNRIHRLEGRIADMELERGQPPPGAAHGS